MRARERGTLRRIVSDSEAYENNTAGGDIGKRDENNGERNILVNSIKSHKV